MRLSSSSLMQRAIDLALDNVRAARGGPFAALIVRDGEIIAEGTNLVTASNDPTAHAEIVAIRRACQHLGSFQLDGCELYSTCEPCPMCLGAIYWARPRALYFAASREDAAQAGFDDEFLYRELNVPLDARRIPTARLLSDEARRIFEAWNAQPNKIHY